jgi:2,4-dienoyl-CoA reductase (NADPH2)
VADTAAPPPAPPPTPYPHLLAPGRIGSLELRNRILLAPMGDSLGNEDGTVSEVQQAYYEARARGGAALLVVGSVSVAYPNGRVDARQTAASDDRFLPGLRALTARAHAHGAAIAAQLVHNGAQSLHDIERGEPMLVPAKPAPPHPDALTMMVTPEELAAFTAPFTTPQSRVRYRIAGEADLVEVVEQFAAAVDRCRRAGFDGVEIHAGHGYLVDEFLTPSLNERTDGWGGDADRRARLLCEVLRAARARVGRDYPLWIRINALEHHKPDGERFDEQLRAAELAVEAGADAVHVTAYSSPDVATGPTDSYVPHVVGDLARHAAAVRAVVGVPVVTFGRFEPDEAEAVLAAGAADFVAMGRKLLADPDLPRKLAAGRRDDVRPCIYQYRCIGNIFVKDVVHCVANAATGREDSLAAGRTASPRRVLVVGGGPAGLEAARTLASEGHAVTLWDAADRLGGTLALAARADPLLDRYLGWLVTAVERAGVGLVPGRPADTRRVLGAGADAVVVATGARWARPPVPGAEHAVTVPELRGWLDGDDTALGARVVVVGGGKVGLTLARHARATGRAVTVLEPGAVLAPELGLPGRFRWVADAETEGVDLRLATAVESIDPGGVVARRGEDAVRIAADSVVVTSERQAGSPLADALRAEGVAVTEVGDCRTVAGIEGANLDAALLAVALR